MSPIEAVPDAVDGENDPLAAGDDADDGSAETDGETLGGGVDGGGTGVTITIRWLAVGVDVGAASATGDAVPAGTLLQAAASSPTTTRRCRRRLRSSCAWVVTASRA
ncbi:MAG: hypothetical protein ACJ77N_02740 [Chloroflexota bacterium]